VVSLAGDTALFGAPGLSSQPARRRLGLAPRKAEVALVGAEHFVFTGGCGPVRRLLTPTAGEVLSPGRADVEDVRYRAVGC